MLGGLQENGSAVAAAAGVGGAEGAVAGVAGLERMPCGRWSGRFTERERGWQLLGEAVGQQGCGPVQSLGWEVGGQRPS